MAFASAKASVVFSDARNALYQQITSGEQRYDRHLHRLALPLYDRINGAWSA